MLYPANRILESYVFAGWAKTKKRQWSKNFSRTVMVAITVLVTIGLKDKADKFLSILGSVSCTPVAFIFPAAFHYKVCAKTRSQQIIDLSLVFLWVGLGIYCTVLGVQDWNE